MKSRTLVILIIATCCIAVSLADMSRNSRDDSRPDPPRVNKIMDEFLQNDNIDVKTFYKTWHFAYNKKYDYNTIEGINKYKTFKQNVKYVREHNAKNLSWKAGMNEYSDMTNEEFSARFNLDKELPRNKEAKKLLSLDDYQDKDGKDERPPMCEGKFPELDNSAEPYKAIDWREYTLPIRNQGYCGSCWAFTMMALMETQHNIENKNKMLTKDEHLSVQYMIDCNDDNFGCNGGWFSYAYPWVQDKFLYLESDYKYKKRQQSYCQTWRRSKLRKMVRPSECYESDSPQKLAYLLSRGVAWVLYDAFGNDFQHYRSGILNKSCIRPNHAMLAVGYGYDENNEGYFIVRNSAGTSWGEDGYVRIKRDMNNKESCFIESSKKWFEQYSMSMW